MLQKPYIGPRRPRKFEVTGQQRQNLTITCEGDSNRLKFEIARSGAHVWTTITDKDGNRLVTLEHDSMRDLAFALLLGISGEKTGSFKTELESISKRASS